jgi:hypothetical protein
MTELQEQSEGAVGFRPTRKFAARLHHGSPGAGAFLSRWPLRFFAHKWLPCLGTIQEPDG